MKVTFLTDSQGNKSLTRLITFIASLLLLIMTAYMVYEGAYVDASIFFAATFLPLLSAKVWQKQVEMKSSPDGPPKP